MARGKASGYTLKQADVPIIKGMEARGDRDHDIAAWFGVNQGRVAEAKDGKYGPAAAAPADQLPPRGPPGLKGRRLRSEVEKALDVLAAKGPAGLQDVTTILQDARARYDKHEM